MDDEGETMHGTQDNGSTRPQTWPGFVATQFDGADLNYNLTFEQGTGALASHFWMPQQQPQQQPQQPQQQQLQWQAQHLPVAGLWSQHAMQPVAAWQAQAMHAAMPRHKIPAPESNTQQVRSWVKREGIMMCR